MVTGEQVYNLAMGLMDEVGIDGSISSSAAKNYHPKTPQILTQLQAELLPSATAPVIISDLNQPLLLSDTVCIKVLPYGLAAHLALSEDPNLASFYNSRYEELRSKLAATITPITDVYDVTSGMR